MKSLFAVIVLVSSAAAHAGECDLVSGYFKTTTTECRFSRDGVSYQNEGAKDIKVVFNEATKALTVTMNVSSGPYDLNYIADGKEQIGRPQYEGEKYTAQCAANHIHTRSEISALKYPLVHDYIVTADGKMTYQETFEGNPFIRICDMNRN